MTKERDPLRVELEERIENDSLLVIVNSGKDKCDKCGFIHPFITNDCKPIVFRSDDDKAKVIYGPLGEFQSARVVADEEVYIRDHRFDPGTVPETPET